MMVIDILNLEGLCEVIMPVVVVTPPLLFLTDPLRAQVIGPHTVALLYSEEKEGGLYER